MNGSSRLRILFSAERIDIGIEDVPFAFSRSTWEVIAVAFALPSGFLDYLSLHLSVATDFNLDGTRRGFMATIGSSGIALTFDRATCTTTCLVVGLCEHHLSRFKSELAHLSRHVSNPKLVVMIWLSIFSGVRVRQSRSRQKELENIQLQMGMHFTIDKPLLYRSSLDIEALIHKITVMWHSLGWDEFALKTLIQTHSRLGDVFGYSATEGTLTRNIVDIHMSNTHDLLLSLQNRTVSSVQHANIHLQTIYNFVNQRDSLVNIDHAAASRQLAELSLHDSSVMRSIAYDSNKVAVLTRKDSTDMRIIAAVTLGFLPPTFIATLFSTDFFHFQPTAEGKVVSPWIWLYALFATVLTTFVLGGWYIFSKQSARQFKEAFQHAIPETPGLRALPETTIVTLATLPNGMPSSMRALTRVAAAAPPGTRRPPLGAVGSESGASGEAMGVGKRSLGDHRPTEKYENRCGC